MTDDRLRDFERAVNPLVEFLYRVAVALAADPEEAEAVLVGTLWDAARSWNGATPDRGLLLGSLYRRVSTRGAQQVGGVSLDVLPQPYRDVVVLSSLPGVRAQDVAKALGLPAETVRTRRRRAFALLFRKQDAKPE